MVMKVGGTRRGVVQVKTWWKSVKQIMKNLELYQEDTWSCRVIMPTG